MDSQRLNRLRKSDKIKNIHLDKCFMDIAEVSIDMSLEVIGVKNFWNHNEPTLHGIFSIIEVIPHGSLGLSPKKLVSTSVLPLMEAIRVLLPNTAQCIDMHSAQIFRNLLFLLHISWTMLDALYFLGWIYPMSCSYLGL
jgi:hypothetical protein